MKLAAVFSDHAVLQHGIPLPIWGWTRPHTEVVVSLGTTTAVTCSGADGRFLVRLPPLAPGGPFELIATADNQTVRVRDVLLGEVWLASGQSNMEWTLAMCGAQGDETIQAATDERLRMIKIPCLALAGRQSDVVASWQVASPQTAGEFSAVAYHFADTLQKDLDMPVGIVNASWGGTIIEAWTSREALIAHPATRAWTERYEANLHHPDYWSQRETGQSLTLPADPGNRGEAEGWAAADCSEGDWSTMELPRMWQTDGHHYSGVFWFRRTVAVPPDWAGHALSLKIGAVDKQDTTYFNGVQVGATGQGFDDSHWNEPRDYTVPGELVIAGVNVIAVRAYSFLHGGGMIGPGESMSLSRADGMGKPLPLAGPWRYRVERDFGLIQPPQPPMGPGNPNSPYILYDNLIHPLIPYAIRGAIWYQGESNANDAGQYRDLMVNLIRDWRRAWGQGTFPFLQVQLANFMQAATYHESSAWARLREAQWQALAEPETGMAVAIDIGEAIDIHPKNKRDVGHRLAQWALVETYAQSGVPSGPLYTGMTIAGKKLRLHFKHVGNGLVAQGENPLGHFVVAGADRRFHPATATIEGANVMLESPQVAEPVAARYAWADNPEGCNLANRDGFPASPFRTDNW